MLRALALLAILLLAPAASAVSVQVLDDPAGDLDYQPGGVVPPGHDPTADLLRLSIDEGPTTLRFTLEVTPAEDGPAAGADGNSDGAEYTIAFRRGTYIYEIRAAENQFVDGQRFAAASLYVLRAPGDSGDHITGLATSYDVEAGAIRIDVEREDLRDDQGIEPFRGQSLPDVWVASRTLCTSILTPCEPAGALDRMPDEGVGEAVFQLGAPQTGHALLSAEGRVRASNGAATTYLWRMNLTNTAETPDTFTLSVSDVPPIWEMRLPYPSVEVPGNTSIHFPILVTVPFAHQHGAFEFATVQATSLADADASAGLDIGIEYLATPQPAGHHDTVFIHAGNQGWNGVYITGLDARFGFGPAAYMNTDPDDPHSSAAAASGWGDGSSGEERTGWVVPLSPRLRLGLDADLTDTGEYSLSVSSPTPLTGATLDGKLVVVPRNDLSSRASHYDNGAGTRTVATLETSGPTDIGVDEIVTFTGSVVPHVDGDLIEYDAENQLALVLNLRGTGVHLNIGAGDQALLYPGGSLRLPLDEYHDPVDASFSAPDFITLATTGSVDRDVAAGGTALWNLTLRNGGEDDHAFAVTVSGLFDEWAHLPAGDFFLAPANRSIDIPVAITAPPDARIGDRADVIIEAVNVKDPRMRGLLRVSAEVVPGDALALSDDAEAVAAIEEASQKDTPSVAVIPILVGLLVLAVRRRRL